ncbi:putative transcription factor C2C2-CO-like family [Helianthus annuus]|uniref:Transcription factor C2C2-CO-like family n=2 Tax=Helianthus annuus TaxID=4232 RepID=A0A9K3HCP2_HELAN|nr:putative transcription factor C2C2-CO-like family [Helianthus annuus]KAJ0477086.1 putative transcription factor C2C2-CO-like family [Helianthus annuus]KAJ0497907.1 putative transcription factor C2C2-CO-like family [Helianthus annuus]KAJ0663914.1 putative transcription factor C2C2-CO-like family [Helianthus annuus]KAJ0671402.1 putative transcription factor C2C2-CO-like family [Helianthus annuus]
MMLDVAKQEKDRIIRSRCINLLMMEITRMRNLRVDIESRDEHGTRLVPNRYRKTGKSATGTGTEYTAKDLSIENYEELFGVGHNDPKQLFAKDGIDSLFGGAESSYAGKETSNPACSNATSADSLRSCKTEPNPCSYARQHSNISFSSLTGESSAGEYHLDCDASSMLLMGDPPRCNPGACPDQTTTPSGSRSDVVLRYKEKKKMRKFEKRVRYATRN